ncbi:GIY-YIG nuclease family protein [Arcanobacterium phocae]|uniref:GIY-YIG nuclease family protein n=1 Tax=Arcanobacterium phocae TaxID=131112 RepID=UPI0026464869|nr:GIY-YIG nuclease family protein [Arcanobacterium phocae]
MEQLSSTLEKDLEKLLASDTEGLLDTPERPKKLTSEDRLEHGFLEILEFFEREGRVPSSETQNVSERKLGARLDGILANPERIQALQHLDTSTHLLAPPPAPTSLDDILNNDEYNLLGDETGIFDITGLPARSTGYEVEDRAQRIKAHDFERFEHLFKEKHRELQNGILQLAPFNGIQNIKAGKFFVLKGLMLFVAEIGEDEFIRDPDGRERKRQRIRAIFENGTESSMFRQSLRTRLNEEDGLMVVDPSATIEGLTDGDEYAGHIYVLKSLSTNSAIQSIPNLYKIGFSTTSVEKRIANAIHEPTYLMEPVEIVADYRVYNLRASALEHLLHRIFADVRLDLAQIGADGSSYDVTEWFTVPLSIIDEAIQLILSGDIINYHYDRHQQKLVDADLWKV